MSDVDTTQKLALSEFIRRAGQRFITLAPGEEEAGFDRVVVGLAEVLDLTLVARWDVARGADWPTRRMRWVRDGVELAPPPARIDAHNPFVTLATTATRPQVLDDPDELDENGLLSASAHARRLTRLLVPGRSDASVDCVLVLGRPLSRPWLDYEQEMLADFAVMIPRIRARIDVEHRIAASFEAAPVGMTLRTSDHVVAECNHAFGEFVGELDPARLIGRKFLDLVDADVADGDVIAALSNPPTEGHRHLEVPFRHVTGRTVWARMAETRISTQHGDRWLSYAEDVTELRRRQEIVRRRAQKDELTGLANRHELLDVLANQLNTPPDPEGRAACAVIVIDLNGFKSVNDTYGHAAGDVVLVGIGRRLVKLSRSADLVARYGGDEFVVVLAGPIDADDADRVAQKLAAVATSPIAFGEIELHVGAAVGVAVGSSGDAATDVITRADDAMYTAKRRSKAQEPPIGAPALVAIR